MMDATQLGNLRLTIRNAKVSTQPAEKEKAKKFMPEGRLEEILKFATIASALANPSFGIPEHKLSSTVEIVAQECPKLLAILIELELEKNLLHFLQMDILDSQLPRGLEDPRIKDLLSLKAVEFDALQWEYFPFQFRTTHYQRTIGSEVIVPYIVQQEVGKGGFSRVYKVMIHPAQQRLMLQKATYLARKRICVSSDPSVSEQNDEAELLFFLGSVKHRNIVELLAAYRQGEFVNLLFPYFEQDLHKFLLEGCRPPGFEEDVTFLQAMHGLSSGLAHLHQFFPRSNISDEHQNPAMQGYHHDIKPRNILIANRTFVLSDFGCADIKPPDSDTKTGWKDTTFEYGAPECRDMTTFIPGKVGRALDIWSLGCIFTEVVTYMTSGSSGVLDFREQRRIQQFHGTVRCFHDGSKLSPQVDNHLNLLLEKMSLPSRNIFHLMRAMFCSEPEKRPSAKVVENFIAVLALEVQALLLLERIDTMLHHRDSKESSIFLAQATIERTRLKAWAHVIGLNSKNSSVLTIPNHLREAILNISNMSKVIQTVAERVGTFEQADINSPSRGTLLNLIRSMNDELCLLTPEQLRRSMDDTFLTFSVRHAQETPTGHKDLSSQLDQNANVLGMLEQLEDFTVSRGVWELQNLGKTSAMKRLSILFAEQKLQPNSAVIMWSDISPNQVGDGKFELETRLYKGMRTVVEWQDYSLPNDLHTMNDDSDLIVYSLYHRMQALATMLGHQPKPDAFRVLDCLGTVHDEKENRWGLLYNFPAIDTHPVQLHRIFRHNRTQDKLPNPSEKLRLAKALVNALSSFHLSGWVHKNINSFNIVFFLKDSDNLANLDISEPYVVDFNHSRPNTPNAVSFGANPSRFDKEYQHPSYRREGIYYRQHYDYYSLGLVLLEIGTWNPLSKIFGRIESLTLSPNELTKEYIKCCDNDLLLLMGEKYTKVTKECLQVDHWDNKTEATSVLEFQTRVVEEIRTCNF